MLPTIIILDITTLTRLCIETIISFLFLGIDLIIISSNKDWMIFLALWFKIAVYFGRVLFFFKPDNIDQTNDKKLGHLANSIYKLGGNGI